MRNVVSFFDGKSGAQLALNRAGVQFDGYYAAEIDKYAMQVTQHNFPDTTQLGSVTEWQSWGDLKPWLATAGSPRQDLSRVKNDGKGLDGEKSKLFFEFYNYLEANTPPFFLLENVVMDDASENQISELLGVQPFFIDSGIFSAQNRPRLYWTNIPVAPLPKESPLVLNDIMQPIEEIAEKYFYNEPLEIVNGHEKRVYGTMNKFYENGKRRMTDTTSRVYSPLHKCGTLTAVAGGHQEKKVFQDGRIRKLTPLEYERLQTIPDNYTACVSDSQRYKMLGNGWTIDVIAHIFEGLKQPAKTTKEVLFV